ncbi:hypothetical protein D9Q98_003746 [Chlorella vulgaris]|uniref:Protein kinase domain-containing protein n=1 Tax=Chlorella vulgaris TaxID=3077 RepID=A0A9D4TTP1_CHLVU|nr:hypothetical protein D9Q98_003746 [Chlorella vulgaris]
MCGSSHFWVPLAAALLAILVAGPLAATASADSIGINAEAAVMLGLRQALWDEWGPAFDWSGWNVADLSHHCSWSRVDCDEQQRVTALVLKLELNIDIDRPSKAAVHSGLPAAVQALASLRWLTYLNMDCIATTPLPVAMLEAWVQPGAFPRLQSLIMFCALMSGGSLPDVLPTSLPSLQLWTMDLAGLRSTLPASWGASPAALPALQTLNLRLQIEGQLPPQWGTGFRKLRILTLTHIPPEDVPGNGLPTPAPAVHSVGAAPGSSAAVGLPAPSSSAAGLPVEWAAGFPWLQRLEVDGMQLEGSLPEEWIEGLPRLTFLALNGLSLSGSLPAALIHRHPGLTSLWLDDNRFTGTLPTEWAEKGMHALSLRGNQLTGPAFPPSWLQQGALVILILSGNHGLTGTLPASLPWPYFNELDVSDTGLTGLIPEAWCNAPFAQLLSTVNVKGSGIDPVLPPCAARDLPLLINSSSWSLPLSLASNLTSDAQTGTSTRTVGVAVLLPGAALLAAAAGGWMLWQRRLRRGWYVAVQKVPPDTELDERLGPASWRSRTAASRTGEWVARGIGGKRARLASLVTSRASGGVSMIPLAPLPAAPAHHLPLRQASAADRGNVHASDNGTAWGVAVAVPAADSPRQQPQLAGGKLSPAEGNELPGSGVCNLEAATWGLATFSLQLQDGMLEFVSDGGGQLMVLGEGGHAVVYLARLRGIAVAVKVFELQPGTDCQAMWREAAILRDCKHERIMALHGVAISGQLVMLAMQLMQGGSVYSALQDPHTRQQLRWEHGGRQVAMDVAEGLHYLHTTLGVMHSDVKSGNVLLTRDVRACLGDMSVAKAVGSQARSAAGFCCTHGAPEQLLGFQCTLAADLYGFGILLIELTTQQTVQRRGDWRLPLVPGDCSQAVLTLIEDCIQQDPQRRCTAAEALQRLQAEVGAGP